MKHIIEIGLLYDKHIRMNFGSVGKDLETGEIHFYTKYDKSGHYIPNGLFEFNINQKGYCEDLSRNLSCCHYIKDKDNAGLLPKEILPLTYEMINKHLTYNKENGYPIEYLTKNSSDLSVEYTSSLALFDDSEFSGIYSSLLNTILIPITASEWNHYTDQEKKNAKDTLLHETGHLKVSTHKLDMENKQLIAKTGFLTSFTYVEPIVLPNGDIYLTSVDSLDNDYERILEEVMNDYDCKKINPDFYPVYPNVGHILNELCDGRLQMARYYDDGIEELYESLFKLDNSRDMADELLGSIKSASEYVDSNNDDNKRMMKLLNQYQKKHTYK